MEQFALAKEQTQHLLIADSFLATKALITNLLRPRLLNASAGCHRGRDVMDSAMACDVWGVEVLGLISVASKKKILSSEAFRRLGPFSFEPAILKDHRLKSTQCQIWLWCMVFDINALIGQNLTSKSKWWVLIIGCKWEPNVELVFDVCVDSRQCLTDTSKSNSTLGTFSGKCPEGWYFASLP